MIICIEGPDRSGKTTLLLPLAAALNATPITRLETSAAAAKAWPYIEPVYLHLLEQLMQPGVTYVTDRSMTVSAQVYAAVFRRPLLFDPTPWWTRELIVYVDTPLDVLRSRHKAEDSSVFPVELYERTIAEYKRVLKDYRTLRVDGTQSVEHNVSTVVSALRHHSAIFSRMRPDGGG